MIILNPLEPWPGELSLDAAEKNGVSRAEAEDAVQEGLTRAIDDAQDAGALEGSLASFAHKAVEAVPPWLLLQTLDRLRAFLP